MITLGSISRDTAASRFPFLAESFRGRRNALKDFTDRAPDFVFWIYPEGKLFDARDAHGENVPRGFDHILDDEPDYGGFLRGRLATSIEGHQLIVVYCRPEALASAGDKLSQLLYGLAQLPVPLRADALVVSDNADIYGTIRDLRNRNSGWVMLPDYSHQVLGAFTGLKCVNSQGRTFVELEKKGSTHIAGLGFVFETFTISLETISEPPPEMLSDLVGIVQWPKLRVPEIEGRLYEYYAENRPEYLDACRQEGLGVDEIARCVPEVKRPDEVWKLIESPFYISGSTWEHPAIAFRCVFDIEHELHISFSNNRVHKIWNE